MNDTFPGPDADDAGAVAPDPVDSTDSTDSTRHADAIEPVAPVEDLDPVTPEPVFAAVRPGPVQAPGRQAATRRQNGLALAGTIVLLVALAFGGGFAVGRATGPTGSGGTAVATPGATTAPAGATTAPSSGPTSSDAASIPTPAVSSGPAIEEDGPRLGSATAKVVMDYWADFQCPFCSKFAKTVLPQLTSRIEDGTLAVVHRDFAFIGPESIAASIAVRCAGRQGKYWAMHDAVYAAQSGENQGAFSAENLAAIAASVGLDDAAYTSCIADHAVLVEVLDDTSAGHRAGIKSTPTIDINGNRFLGVEDAAKLIAAIDAAAGGASPAPLPTAEPLGDPWIGTGTNGREAGDSTAKVTVELWMDYAAKASTPLVQTLEPELRKRIDSGAVHLVQRDLALLGDDSVNASAAVRCTADQGGPAWFMHDILGANAPGPDAAVYTTDTLLRVATQLGLDIKAFDACLANPATAQAVIAETATGKAAGMTEGPTVVISAGGKEVARFSGTLDDAKVLAAIDGVK